MKNLLPRFKSEIKSTLIISLIAWILIFVVFWYAIDILNGFLFSTVFIAPALFLMLSMDTLNDYTLKNGVKSKRFAPLLTAGFRLVEHQKIPLLTGKYRDFHFDIYFSNFDSRKMGGYVFTVYYEPISSQREFQLSDKYYLPFLSFKPYLFTDWNKSYARVEIRASVFPQSHKKNQKTNGRRC